MRTPVPGANARTELLIMHNLTHLGVPANLKGYEYLKCGLRLILENPAVLQGLVTKELYPDIAKECGTTASRVERAIRHSVEVVFDRVDPELLDEYFGRAFYIRKKKPTNTEFLAKVSEYIRMELGAYR